MSITPLHYPPGSLLVILLLIDKYVVNIFAVIVTLDLTSKAFIIMAAKDGLLKAKDQVIQSTVTL